MKNEPEKSGVGYDWCVDIHKNEVKIQDAISGKHEYFCGDCGCEMIAKKGFEMAHHFAHDATDVIHYGTCTFANESYRHKVAKRILQIIKKIKVPALKKYPPLGIEGKPNLLEQSKLVLAHTVEIEMSFYEDAEGKVAWGKRIDFEGDKSKYFFIRPDVSFFDENGTPILLIEIVVTHKISDEKLFKIKQLGINTIQIIIPNGNDEAIEKVFLNVSHTKWVYNHDQETTKYVPNSSRTPNENNSPDEFEKGILESGESFKCRTSQINNVIRAINKFMESGIYRAEIARIESEAAVVETSTVEHRQRLQRLQEGHKEHLELQFGEETQRVESIRESLNKRDQHLFERRRRMDEEKSNVERRYKEKREGIDTLQREYRASCEGEIEEFTARLGECRDYPNSIEESLDRIKKTGIELTERHRIETNRIEKYTKDEIEQIESIESRREALRAKYDSVEKSIRKEYSELGNIVQAGFRNQFEDAIKSITDRDFRKTSSIATDLQGIIHAEGFFDTFKIQKPILDRMREAKRQFESGSYKNWV